MKYCECGCSKEIKKTNRFAVGHSRKNCKLTDEHKLALLKSNLGKKRTEKTKEKIRNTVSNHWNDPESIYHTEKFKEKRIEYHKRMKGRKVTEEVKKEISTKQKLNWKDENHTFNSKDFRNTLSKKHKELWNDSNGPYRKELRSKKISSSMKKLYKDPDYLKKLQNGLMISPNRCEIQIANILEEINYKFIFTGNFSYWIGGRNPDFINKKDKKNNRIFWRLLAWKRSNRNFKRRA